MGYMLMTAPCWACGRKFSFSPSRVPSVRVKGKQEPICWYCLKANNSKRVEDGLQPILPLPGAYESEEVEY